MTVKIGDLAAKLGLTNKEVVSQAVSMGIAAKTASSSISDEDALAVENALKNKNTEETETKVVRAESKKSVSADDGEPKVQVKAAKVVKAATPKKSQPKTDKKSESAPVRKAPIGRPITKAEAESRRRPAGTPITKKEKAEKEAQAAREKEEILAQKKAE